ncbi:MAG: putative C-S lyase [Deltaproteobacteria bacterium]|nr:putative C-S lyase [Deltaproteobacteria bacterium]
MKYNFDEIIDRSNTYSLKWEKYKSTGIIPMWVADMDFKTPPAIQETLKKTIEHGILGYTIIPDELNNAVIARLKVLYDWKVEKGWVIWLPGVVCGLNVACAAFGAPQDKIVTTTPIYPPFLSAPGNCGKILATVPMIDVNQRATLDFNALENELKENTGLFMFCNPYNPCGTVFAKEEINKLVELCAAYDVIICSDEIHSDFILDEGRHHIPAASLSKTAAGQTITLMAPSKTYNIPGLGCSFAIIPDKGLRNKFKSSLKGLIPDVNLLGLFAAKAAYTECDKWLSALIAYLRKNRDIVQYRVNKMKGCKLNLIESTYLAWVDVRGTGLKDPVSFFEKAGIGVSDGSFFGQKGFIRLNFGCPVSLLKEGLKRMGAALESL